ncbi:hypothetical protein DB31_3665 [Hyalangium minutum]|uniref:Uncharacterized protein n=1 Tax=Hyalangium minutum TaxID=394096 RepID=A0A085WV22_9BACT|nr:hypothetical protein DB31_3665 [Hyalangium minutum]
MRAEELGDSHWRSRGGARRRGAITPHHSFAQGSPAHSRALRQASLTRTQGGGGGISRLASPPACLPVTSFPCSSCSLWASAPPRPPRESRPHLLPPSQVCLRCPRSG